MSPHLIILPILIPMSAAAIMLLLGGRRRARQAGVALGANLALLVAAVLLAWTADGAGNGGQSVTYRVGDWPTEVAIVLVADRLSVLMVLIAAFLGAAASLFAIGAWSRLGPHFHALLQFLLMGLNGAFLTGDLFNLFVFFEILLAASYGLLLHGSGVGRVSAGLHYIVINLVASLLFLVGVAMIFGVTGTLNMAILSERIPDLTDGNRNMLHTGAAILGMAFLVKAAAWPLGFWLPRAYDAAVPPAAAMFAIMTKVGVYALLRLRQLVFGGEAGSSAGFGGEWLFVAGIATIVVGLVGMLAARDLGRLTGYSLLVSAGTLLAAIVFADPVVLAGGLFYLTVSTLSAGALYMLGGLIGPHGNDKFDEPQMLEAYDPGDDDIYANEDERAVFIPAPIGILSGAFLICTMLIAGLPPLPGFLAKFAMLSPLFEAPAGPVPAAALITAAFIIVSSFFALIGLARAGIQIWWAEPARFPPTIRLNEAAAVSMLLVASLMLTIAAQGAFGFLQRTAEQVLDSRQYVSAVLGSEAPQ